MERILEFEILKRLAKNKGCDVEIADMEGIYDGLLYGNGLRPCLIKLSQSKKDKELIKVFSHELAHLYLHGNKKNLIENPSPEAEEDADRAGQLLVDAIELQNEMLGKRLKRNLDYSRKLQAENEHLKALLQQNHIEA